MAVTLSLLDDEDLMLRMRGHGVGWRAGDNGGDGLAGGAELCARVRRLPAAAVGRSAA